MHQYNRLGMHQYNRLGVDQYNRLGMHQYNRLGVHQYNRLGVHQYNRLGVHQYNRLGMHQYNRLGVHQYIELYTVCIQIVSVRPSTRYIHIGNDCSNIQHLFDRAHTYMHTCVMPSLNFTYLSNHLLRLILLLSCNTASHTPPSIASHVGVLLQVVSLNPIFGPLVKDCPLPFNPHLVPLHPQARYLGLLHAVMLLLGISGCYQNCDRW